jgi:hypothetical protein
MKEIYIAIIGSGIILILGTIAIFMTSNVYCHVFVFVWMLIGLIMLRDVIRSDRLDSYKNNQY